ncbi:MAG: hypothetical protein P4L00_09395 [Candidatus Acidoferrales bacterium]|nr:hypothetical protein [Candidatus Acidoferrales bacterium]
MKNSLQLDLGRVRLRDIERRSVTAPALSINRIAHGTTLASARIDHRRAQPLLVYLLVRSATERQDRVLLPSDEDWQATATNAALLWYAQNLALLFGGQTPPLKNFF